MSGGYWEYEQWRIQDIADRLEEYIYGRELDDESDEDYYIGELFYWNEDDKKEVEKYVREHHSTLPNIHNYSDETITEFKNGLDILRLAYIYAQRIDWLLSGDDGEESFHERLEKELNELTKSDGEN